MQRGMEKYIYIYFWYSTVNAINNSGNAAAVASNTKMYIELIGRRFNWLPKYVHLIGSSKDLPLFRIPLVVFIRLIKKRFHWNCAHAELRLRGSSAISNPELGNSILLGTGTSPPCVRKQHTGHKHHNRNLKRNFLYEKILTCIITLSYFKFVSSKVVGRGGVGQYYVHI